MGCKKIIRLATAILPLGIAACVSPETLDYLNENYPKATTNQELFINKAGKRYYILTNANRQDVISLAPLPGEAFRGGLAKGATFGAATPFPPEQIIRSQFQEYVDAKRPNCQISDVRLILEPTWEAFLTCSIDSEPAQISE